MIIQNMPKNFLWLPHYQVFMVIKAMCFFFQGKKRSFDTPESNWFGNMMHIRNQIIMTSSPS